MAEAAHKFPWLIVGLVTLGLVVGYGSVTFLREDVSAAISEQSCPLCKNGDCQKNPACKNGSCAGTCKGNCGQRDS